MKSFHDFEEAYYYGQWETCIQLGKQLLSSINNDRSIELLEALNKVHYSWDLSEEEARYLTKLLNDVKIWLMIHSI